MSPCDSCHSGCCRAFAIPVTGADIIKIERGLKLDFWDFVCRWADPDGSIARNNAPHFFFADEPNTPFVICTTHAPSSFHEGSTKCRFLVECAPDEENPIGASRCGIYNHRPSSCHAFPMKLDDAGELTILYQVPQHGREDKNPLYDLCPREWEIEDIDPIEAPQQLSMNHYEINFFNQVAQIWNRNPREWEVFPEFLQIVYHNRVMKQESPKPADDKGTIPFSVA
jgi:Fe-S-cluster containining protein